MCLLDYRQTKNPGPQWKNESFLRTVSEKIASGRYDLIIQLYSYTSICEQNKYMIIWSLYDDSSHTYTSDATCNSHSFYLSFVFGFAMYHPPVLSEARHRQYRETPVPHVSGCPAEVWVCVEVRADIVALRWLVSKIAKYHSFLGKIPVSTQIFQNFSKNHELFKREWLNYLLLERSTKSASVAGKFEYFPLMLL